MGNENQLYSISLGVASLQGGLVGVATTLSPATCRPFQVFSPSFFVGLELTIRHPTIPHVPDHILSSLIGTSLLLPVKDGEPLLGEWQRIVLVECDGLRTRQIAITFMLEK